MLDKSQLVTLLRNNIDSPFCTGVSYFLLQLIERNIPTTSDIPRYRMKNTLTDSDITNLNDLKSVLDPNNLSISLCRTNKEQSIITPMILTPLNISVHINSFYEEDNEIASIFGSGYKRLNFSLTYFGDLDTTLPLKIKDIYLTSI